MSLNHLWKKTNFEAYIVQGLSTTQYIARLQSLGLDPSKGTQKPFKGMDYDVCVMIDPETLFNPEDLSTLIERCLDKYDAVSGLYHIDPTHYFASDPTEKELLKHNEINDKESVTVPFTGLGFFACRKAVLDSLTYPFFNNVLSEEASFCKSITEAGFKITLCKDIKVGRILEMTM